MKLNLITTATLARKGSTVIYPLPTIKTGSLMFNFYVKVFCLCCILQAAPAKIINYSFVTKFYLTLLIIGLTTSERLALKPRL